MKEALIHTRAVKNDFDFIEKGGFRFYPFLSFDLEVGMEFGWKCCDISRQCNCAD